MAVIELHTNKTNHYQHAHHHKSKTKNHHEKTEETRNSSSFRSSRRRLSVLTTTAPQISPSNSLNVIIQDLKNMNSDPSAFQKLLQDIGGIQNLSSWRSPDNCWSLLDLCCQDNRILPKAANILLNSGFTFSTDGSNGYQNDLPPRYQWGANGGYCGETSFVTAALNNGEYISQYDARYYATGDKAQQQNLLIGDGSDIALAKYLHLKYEEYPNENKVDPHAFLNWVKNQVESGNQVIMGVYMNKSVFGPDDYQPDYDHIVTVVGVKTDAKGNLISIQFSDNGLYGKGPKNSPYIFSMTVDQLLKNREQANIPLDKGGTIYSLADEYANYGIAIKGSTASSEASPIHIIPNKNDEIPEMQDKSNQRPKPSKVTLTVCATDLKPGKYYIYEYDGNLSNVPDKDINAYAKAHGLKPIEVTINPGQSSYVFTKDIESDQQIAFRCVPADGP
ncbi:MAG: hypothetical protein K1X28_07120 [Parachlamydiales bacterium]|nr:hypothetical protein [Parachlamydiales bacterium]